MDRKQFLNCAGAAALTAALACLAPFAFAESAMPKGKRPNILVIMTDQQAAGVMSCTGNKHLKTPAIDSLAASGVRFANAYCPQPVCVASRTSMMLGRMPHETGVTFNYGHDRRDSRGTWLGTRMTAAGYDCGYTGKWHLPVKDTDVAAHGFTWTRHTDLGAAPDRSKDAQVPGACAEFFKIRRDKPFFLVASFLNPHDVCQWARSRANGRDGLPNGKIGMAPPPDECPPLPANFEIPADEPSVIREHQKRQPQNYPTADWDEGNWRQYLWGYYRLAEKVDLEIGRILAALRDSNHDEDTVVIFVSDHGEGVGGHHWNQKIVLYEESVLVPFIISWKGVTKPGLVDNESLVSVGLDLTQTVLDFAGVGAAEDLHGLSLKPASVGGQPLKDRPFVVSETRLGGGGQVTNITGRMLRTARYKYIVYSEGTNREQLFDMTNDSGETTSLAADPEHADGLRDCRAKLMQWCRETEDPFIAVAVGNSDT